MPDNVPSNPYPPNHPLHDHYEGAPPEVKAVLLMEVARSSEPFAPKNAGPEEDPYAPKVWGGPSEEDFRCPSGQLCRVRRVDVMDLLGDGLLNSVDFMTDAVQKGVIPQDPLAREKIAESGLESIMKDPKKFERFKASVNRVVLRVVVKPTIYPVPNEGFDRQDGLVYVDSISMNDRIALFNYAVTGKRSEEIKQFRPEADESVGAMEPVASVRTETVELPSSSDAP